jgi:hypothetical protein
MTRRGEDFPVPPGIERAVEYEWMRQQKCPDVVELYLFRHRFHTLRHYLVTLALVSQGMPRDVAYFWGMARRLDVRNLPQFEIRGAP